MIDFNKDYFVNIDGNWTTKMPVGYCFCYLHKGYLTKKELVTHNCTQKNCKYLLKNAYHNYWGTQSIHSIERKYVKTINRAYELGKINEIEYDDLISKKNIEFMQQYINEHKFTEKIKEEYQTKSNYVGKKIIHPKKPSIVVRIKNMIKIKYRKFIKKMRIA